MGRLINLALPHSYLIVQIRWSVLPVCKISSVRWPKILHFENMKLSSKVIKSMTPLKRPWTTLLFIVANKSSNRIMSLNPIFFFICAILSVVRQKRDLELITPSFLAHGRGGNRIFRLEVIFHGLPS